MADVYEGLRLSIGVSKKLLIKINLYIKNHSKIEWKNVVIIKCLKCANFPKILGKIAYFLLTKVSKNDTIIL